MTAVGFEPTHPKIVELESTALDHSAKLWLVSVEVKLCSIIGNVIRTFPFPSAPSPAKPFPPAWLSHQAEALAVPWCNFCCHTDFKIIQHNIVMQAVDSAVADFGLS